ADRPAPLSLQAVPDSSLGAGVPVPGARLTNGLLRTVAPPGLLAPLPLVRTNPEVLASHWSARPSCFRARQLSSACSWKKGRHDATCPYHDADWLLFCVPRVL